MCALNQSQAAASTAIAAIIPNKVSRAHCFKFDHCVTGRSGVRQILKEKCYGRQSSNTSSAAPAASKEVKGVARM